MVLLFISILPMCLFHVMGSPQLKLGHSGYELISINEQNADDSILSSILSSKLALEGASRYSGIGAPNLEKTIEPVDENDGFSAVVQQHKRHYDPHRSSSAAKTISESQSNMIDVTNKQSSNKKPNIYLTLGIPKTITNPTTTAKETKTVIPISEKTNQNSQSKDSYDDSDSSEESGSQQKVNAKSTQGKISDNKLKTAAKLSEPVGDISEKNRNQESDIVSPPMFQSDFEPADSKDGDHIINLMAGVQRVWNLIDAKSDFQKKPSKIDPPTVKSGFTMVTHFPSLRINHQKSSYVSHKSPAMFSPIYPSGFNIIAGNPHKKSADPIKELHEKHLRIDHINPKSSKEFGKFYQEKTGQRIPSVLVLNNIHREHSNPRIGSILEANYKAQPYLNQQPIRPMRQIITHLEMNSIPSTTNHFDPTLPAAGSAIFNPQGRWDKIMPRYTIDLAKKHRQNNDFDRQYLDSNHVNSNSELKGDFLKNYFGKMSPSNEHIARHVEPANELLPPNVESSKNLIIGIVHAIAPVDSRETVTDVKKEDLNGETHEMHDVSHPHSSASSKSSCKQMKTSTPAFYQFLTKFSNTVLGKALEYESDTQAQDSVSKLVEATTNKNLDDDILEFLA